MRKKSRHFFGYKKSHNSLVIRQKGESQNGCFKETKHAKFSEKRTFVTPWYAHVRVRVFVLRNVCFLENLLCSVFLKHPFWDSTNYYWRILIQLVIWLILLLVEFIFGARNFLFYGTSATLFSLRFSLLWGIFFAVFKSVAWCWQLN